MYVTSEILKAWEKSPMIQLPYCWTENMLKLLHCQFKIEDCTISCVVIFVPFKLPSFFFVYLKAYCYSVTCISRVKVHFKLWKMFTDRVKIVCFENFRVWGSNYCCTWRYGGIHPCIINVTTTYKDNFLLSQDSNWCNK